MTKSCVTCKDVGEEKRVQMAYMWRCDAERTGLKIEFDEKKLGRPTCVDVEDRSGDIVWFDRRLLCCW
jgi:hypothetical protein